MKTEVANLVNYSAKRILDQFLSGANKMEESRQFLAEDIFKDLKKGQTRDILFNNLEDFNTELNKIVWDRIDYLVAEGFVTYSGSCFSARTEEQIEDFVNGKDQNDEDDFPF